MAILLEEIERMLPIHAGVLLDGNSSAMDVMVSKSWFSQEFFVPDRMDITKLDRHDLRTLLGDGISGYTDRAVHVVKMFSTRS